LSAPKTEPSDEQLALQVKGGDFTAFDALVRRHEGRLFNFLCQKTGDRRDAEDLAQKTFITVYRKIELYDPKHRFETWLYTITRRLTIDHYRHNSRRPDLHGDDDLPEGVETGTPSEALAVAEEKDALWRTIREQVNDNQFTALWMRYEEDLPVAEIAAAMRKTSTNIKVMLHRARERLANHLRSADGATPSVASAGARRDAILI
jgi:RNA polymerase sigma-70 factor (ECF subfamily)